MYIAINEMLGKRWVRVERVDATGDASEELRFIAEDGTKAIFFHARDCCESVTIEDVCGDLADLVGHPLIEATVCTSNAQCSEGGDSRTWTFYRFSTVMGTVTVRWFGISNGYYSEAVSLRVEEGEQA